MVTHKTQPYIVLASSTGAFTVCFMIWMIFSVLGLPIKESLSLNATQFGLLTAMPVLSGSLCRIPLGMMTDRYSARAVFAVLMLICIPPLLLMPYATQYYHFLLISLWLGLIGGSFSVGTPYVARWFPKERQGLAMGIFGAGNAGAALNKLIAPTLIALFGWTFVPNSYAVILLITVILFWIFSYPTPKATQKRTVSLQDQLRLMKNKDVLKYSQYYSVVFGGYVGLSLWMVSYYVDEYGFSLASAALLATCFSLPGGVLRAFGGWLSDKYGAYKVTWTVMWVCWVAFFIMSYPQTAMIIETVNGPFSLNIGLNAFFFTLLIFIVGIALAIGKASVFKFIADDFPDEIGTVSGIVGLAGGLGGFLLPILFGALVDITGIRSSSFMLMYGAVSISLIWMHFSFKQRRSTHRSN